MLDSQKFNNIKRAQYTLGKMATRLLLGGNATGAVTNC